MPWHYLGTWTGDEVRLPDYLGATKSVLHEIIGPQFAESPKFTLLRNVIFSSHISDITPFVVISG